MLPGGLEDGHKEGNLNSTHHCLFDHQAGMYVGIHVSSGLDCRSCVLPSFILYSIFQQTSGRDSPFGTKGVPHNTRHCLLERFESLRAFPSRFPAQHFRIKHQVSALLDGQAAKPLRCTDWFSWLCFPRLLYSERWSWRCRTLDSSPDSSTKDNGRHTSDADTEAIAARERSAGCDEGGGKGGSGEGKRRKGRGRRDTGVASLLVALAEADPTGETIKSMMRWVCEGLMPEQVRYCTWSSGLHFTCKFCTFWFDVLG